MITVSLSPSYTFNGHGNWSLDATSGSATGGGTIDIAVPDGSHIEKAFLYSTTYLGGTSTSVRLSSGAQALTVAGFQSLGTTASAQLTAYRADVTSFVSQVVGDGDPAQFQLSVTNINGTNVDGYALAIVYSNPNEALRTITFLDGYSAQSGDDLSLGFTTPVNTAQPGFQALLSLGIGFGYQTTSFYDQHSLVTVNGRILSQSAGGYDDGTAANGGLITIGGLGDNPSNPGPALPSSSSLGPRYDDELYNLALGDSASATPFLANNASSIQVHTQNPSFDDNIFFAGLNITAQGFGAMAGFDATTYPGDAAMAWLKQHTNLGWVAYYLAPAPSRTSGLSWMGEHDDLVAQGWKLAPIYLGEQDPSNPAGNTSKHPSAAKGTTDGNAAVTLLTQDHFAKGTVVYLDIEPGSLSQDEKDYITNWCAVVSASDFVPGVYCRQNQAPIIADLVPAPLWVVKENDPWNPTPPVMAQDPNAFTSFPIPDPSTAYVDAVARQYVLDDLAQYTIYTPTKSFTADLDSVLNPEAIVGTLGQDSLSGTPGNDLLFGLAGNDTILGGAGKDKIDGGNGNDTIDGGGDADVLRGGAGDDRFVFAPHDGADAITDFVAGKGTDDKINLTAFHITLSAALSHAAQVGSDTVFNFGGGDTLTLRGVTKTTLSSDDFVGLKVLASNDFNGDTKSDILWHNDSGADSIWDNGAINGAHIIAAAGAVPASWHIADKGDFDGNGHGDILWRNDDGSVSIWDNGAIGGAHIISGPGVVANSWHISGTGDFDGNGHHDILWRNDDGSVSLWDNGAIGSAHIISGPGVVANSWHISGTGDFDGNGQSDILWRNDNGAASIWDNGDINQAHIIANAGSIPNGWSIAGTGDFDGNGQNDILWHRDDGTVAIWDNGQIGSAHWIANPGVVAASWHISGTGDFDGNDHSDILWRNDNGAASIWDNGDINQAHIIANAGAIPGGWHIV
jgi:Ca2+-binding RTX toxin-like protein